MVAALGLLVVVIADRGEAARALRVVMHVRPGWLVLVAVLQIAFFFLTARMWLSIGKLLREPTSSLAGLFRLSLATTFADLTMPTGGVAGYAFLERGLRARGLSTIGAPEVAALELLGFYAAQLLAVVASMIVFVVRDQWSPAARAVSIAALVVALVTPLVVLTASTAVIRLLPARLREKRFVAHVAQLHEELVATVRRGPRYVLVPALYKIAMYVVQGLAFAASFAAFGERLPADEAVAIHTVATTAVTATFLPGGIGGFEAASIILSRAAHASDAGALSAVLFFRALTFWLPLVPGAIATQLELRSFEKIGQPSNA
ncbi:integral membrane protein [Labilithrix luteola]|uniref:Integral membrane protein n=1 Tax=Labilithrix luteola TaxID=1391654 RepID=A0A0K1PUB5_9BACT|nr:integral membrane protein [Labilithrix luteola]